MKILQVNHAQAVIEHEAIILAENIFWQSGRTYPQDAIEFMVVKKLTRLN